MQQYKDMLQHIMENGRYKMDRTGTGEHSIFGYQMRFSLANGAFPLVTIKQTFLRGIFEELRWMLNGDTNNTLLNSLDVHIWDEWAHKGDSEERIFPGELGPIYGRQWRDFCGVDQITTVLDELKNNPTSRRIVVSAWNPADLPINGLSPQENVTAGRMALAPCHCLFQFFVDDLTTDERVGVWQYRRNSSDTPSVDMMDQSGIPTKRLSCQLYQRSADTVLGVPFNIASYALLTIMVSKQLGYEPGDFVWTGGDVHIYSNHEAGVKELLMREPYAEPKLEISVPTGTSIFDIRWENIKLIGYQHHPKMAFDVAV